MTSGARNIHALAATVRRLEHEAANGQCAMCGEPSVGFISGWDSIPRGICERHANTAPKYGYTVHRETEARP